MEAIQCAAGIPVPTGSAALQQIELSYDEANWEVVCDSAASIESLNNEPQVGSTAVRVKQLSLVIPTGLTVSSVDGPVSSWQFDADKSRLQIQIDPAAPPEFAITVENQRSLDALPTDVQLSPLRVENAVGEVGLIALAYSQQDSHGTPFSGEPGKLGSLCSAGWEDWI